MQPFLTVTDDSAQKTIADKKGLLHSTAGGLEMAVRKLRYFGDSVLRRSSREVTVIDEKIHRLLADMVETMYSQKTQADLRPLRWVCSSEWSSLM